MLLIDDIFTVGIILLVVGCIVAFIRKMNPLQIIAWSIIYIYGISVLGITLFPIPFQDVEVLPPVPGNIVPFKTILSILESNSIRLCLVQIGGNIAISIPFGFISGVIVKRKSLTYVAPILFPCIIEIMQIVIGLLINYQYRSFDVDDFLLNTLGGYIGLIVAKGVFRKHLPQIRGIILPQATKHNVS